MYKIPLPMSCKAGFMHLRPRHPHLPAWFLLNPSYPLHNPPSPVEAIPADRENTVVCFQHIIACPAHDGFCQIFRYEAVYLVADLEYFLFVHRHSPFQFLGKKCQPSYLTVGIVLFFLFSQFLKSPYCNKQCAQNLHYQFCDIHKMHLHINVIAALFYCSILCIQTIY